ncbi:phage tail domain-containing protein [Lactiplantibacillus plantarum]
MDLLIEKGDSRTYLSQLKVLVTKFEEGAPAITRNSTQIQGRNGNVDFGGWHTSKEIEVEGFYRADDLDEETILRERLYALLSDTDGFYITEMRGELTPDFERPGENEGNLYEQLTTRPSHKRFFVYAKSIEPELQGNIGGTVLYKLTMTFTTMKLPYGESVPRDLDVKKNVLHYSENLVTGTSDELRTHTGAGWGSAPANVASGTYGAGKYYVSAYVENTTGVRVNLFTAVDGHTGNYSGTPIQPGKSGTVSYTVEIAEGQTLHSVWVGHSSSTTESYTYKYKEVMVTRAPSPWNPAPSDPGYNKWSLDTYYNTDNLVIPYAGTVPCSQLEQGFAIEFTAKQSGSNLKISLNGTDFIATGNVYSEDVFKLSGYEYLRNGISIVKATNKAYFKLLPGVTNKISSSLAGEIRILNFQNLYA